MDITEFKRLKIGDIVFVVRNTGSYGIFIYQYIGIFECHTTNESQHVFLSSYFVSTVCILDGQEARSRNLKTIFNTEAEAIAKQKELRLADQRDQDE